LQALVCHKYLGFTVSALFTVFHQAADDNLRDVSGEEENLTDSVELKLDLSLDQEGGVKVS